MVTIFQKYKIIHIMWSIVFVDHNWFSRLIVWRILRSSCFEVRDSAENHFTGVLTHKLPLDMLISLAFAQFWKKKERERERERKTEIFFLLTNAMAKLNILFNSGHLYSLIPNNISGHSSIYWQSIWLSSCLRTNRTGISWMKIKCWFFHNEYIIEIQST